MESKKYTESEAAFHRLCKTLDTLRKECPWDREQTLKSLRYLTIEEVHELSEAIVAIENEGADKDAANELKKELGDLAMHILFYCKIAEERGLFTTADVYNAVVDKLIARHPFIYNKDDYHGESWEQLKLRTGEHRQVLDGVPDTLPSMVKAIRMQEKVAGKETGNPKGRIADIVETELPEETDERELGDRIFALIDWARRHNINADDALCASNRRFRQAHSNDNER